MSLLDDILDDMNKLEIPKQDYKTLFNGIKVVVNPVMPEFGYMVLVGTGIWEELQKESTK